MKSVTALKPRAIFLCISYCASPGLDLFNHLTTNDIDIVHYLVVTYRQCRAALDRVVLDVQAIVEEVPDCLLEEDEGGTSPEAVSSTSA